MIEGRSEGMVESLLSRLEGFCSFDLRSTAAAFPATAKLVLLEPLDVLYKGFSTEALLLLLPEDKVRDRADRIFSP
jgi:hypothetical protein